jgi:hypothetical protein
MSIATESTVAVRPRRRHRLGFGPTFGYGVLGGIAFFVAAGLVFAELATPTGLYGVTQFDDSVYFASARHLVAGALPYRDFTMIQPPGITVLLAPIGLLSDLVGDRSGIALARILTGLVAGANAAGVVFLLRRYGVIAAAIGGAAIAIYPTAYLADHTLMLEPFLVLFCLIGTALAFPSGRHASSWRLVLAGIAFGVAGSVKIWAIMPILAVALVLAFRDWRAPLRLLAGCAIGAVAVCGVFFVAAPHAFIHDVITSQIGRATKHPTPIQLRLFAIDGLADLSKSIVETSSRALVVIVTSLIAVVLLVGSVIPTLLKKGSEFESFVLCAIALCVAALFIPPQFFSHYAYFTTPFIALGLGIAAGRGVRVVQGLLGSFSSAARTQVSAGLAGAVLLVAGVASGFVVASETRYQTTAMHLFGDPGARVRALIPKGACVVADAEPLLVSGDRVVASSSACPIVIDTTGTWISYDPLHPPVRSGRGIKDPKLVAYWANVLRRTDYLIVSSGKSFRIPWTPALRSELAERFVALPGVAPLIYKAKNAPN